MKRSLKVAVLAACPFPTHQGTQVLVRHIAEAQVRAGHEVELFSYGYGEASEQTGFVHHAVPCLNAGLRSGPSLKRLVNDGFLGWGLRKALIKNKFDILHVHNVEGLLIGLALKLSGIKIPLVYQAHNTMLEELPTYYSNRWARLGMRLAGGAFDALLPRWADAQIVFDNAHRELQIRRGASHQNVFVAKPGLDGSELRNTPKVDVNLPEARYIAYCGNPDGYQNLDLLWKSLRLARRKMPDLKLLVLSRAKPEDFGPRALEALEAGGVVFRRYQNLEEMVSYLREAEVGISSRALSTGFPVKLISYLQLGLKAVACRSSMATQGCPKDVWLAPAEPNGFAQAILEAMAAPSIGSTKAPSFEIDESMGSYAQAYDFVLNKVLKPSLLERVG